MKHIAKLIGQFTEELSSAKEYAEKYLDEKIRGSASLANRYKEMALDEIKHSEYLRDEAANIVTQYGNAIEIPEDMEQLWQHGIKRFAEESAIVKNILAN